MGEQADYLLDQMYDHDPMDWDGNVVPSRTKTCRCCGVKDLHWEVHEDGKWRLYTLTRNLHNCRVNPLITKSLLPQSKGPEILEPPANYKVRP